MKYIYWNARGLANPPSRLALQRLITQHKPDFVFISEPWMDVAKFPKRWLSNLHLKMFALNNRPGMIPNIWCFCKVTLNPVIIASEAQHVSFTIIDDTNYRTRRLLWNSLTLLQSQYTLPWCFIGDYNSIIGAHEHKGRISPARLPMEEFKNWTDTNNLIHLPTTGAEYTWANGRGNNRYTERRLDRAITNQLWIDTCNSISVTTLTKHKSDHYPLLLVSQVNNIPFASQFKFLRMWTFHPNCLHIVRDCWNSNVIGCPMFILTKKLKILKERLKSWNKECFGNVHDFVNTAEQNLQHIQDQIHHNGHTDILAEEEKEAHKVLEQALNRQETFWKEKANLNWHLLRDRNTKYFHRIAKIKTATKIISTLQYGDQTLTDQSQITNHIINYYKNIFCSNSFLQDQVLAAEVISSLTALKDLFGRYASESGQVVSTSKSTIFSGSISNGRLNIIKQLLNFSIGSLPFSYLGVPIFKGKPKVSHLQPIADRIKMKLSAWKASLLSMAGRIQLVRSVIQGMIIYSISLYSWPISLIKAVEKHIRNFIWSGDTDRRKLVTVSWKKLCRPYSQGRINIRSLKNLNQATNLKLCWNLLNSQSSWAKLLRDRTIRGKKSIQHHIYSSIWSSIKHEFNTIKENSTWLLGNGADINFWNDNWCRAPLSDTLNIPTLISQHLSSSVMDNIHNGQWILPPQLQQMFPSLNLVHNVVIPIAESHDQLLWKHSKFGDLSLKDAYSFKLQNCQDLNWAKLIWNADVPPSKSVFVWRLMHQKVPTDENLKLRGCQSPSMCNLCFNNEESSFHTFFACPFAVKIWSWFANTLNLTLQFTNMEDMWKICDRNWSPQCKVVIVAALINLLNTIWYARNQARFNDKIITWQSAISLIIANTSLSGNNTCKTSINSIRDFTILKHFKVTIRHPRAPIIKEVLWNPPLLKWTKCNTDGASNGNPGNSSCGGIFRSHGAEFMSCFSEPLGITSSYQAELCGAMRAIEIAHQRNWLNLWLETDSALVVLAFTKPNQL